MTTHNVVGLLLAAALALPEAAAAQSTSAESGQDLHKVREGQSVWAVRTDGREIKGKVLRISPASLDLSVRETIPVFFGILYKAKPSAPALTIAPVLSRGGVGISGSVRW